MKIDDLESSRINEIIDVACRGDWPVFKTLSDEPFLNEAAMREMFDMSSAELNAMSEIKVTPFPKRLPDGDKGIYCQITDNESPDREVTLILHSTNVGGHRSIGILVFMPRQDF